jgi:energy-coupling factor transporter transmembrane protein EcfT
MGIAAPFGTYVMTDSRVHRLDARVKLVLLLALTVMLFVCQDPALVILCAMALVPLVLMARVPPSSLARGVLPCIVILAFSFLANAFVLDGTADLVLWGNFGLSWSGLARGAMAVARIVLLVCYALVVSATTTSNELADGLVSLMMPLRVLHVPVGDIAMTLSIALRFIPVTVSEFDRIRAAQSARGADFEKGSVFSRVARWGSVFVPLVVSLFVRADSLADAMRDRCYQGSDRTRLSRPLRRADVVVLVVGIVACCGVCAFVVVSTWAVR